MSPYDDDDIGKNFILRRIRYGLANIILFYEFRKYDKICQFFR